jgi:hypothetical protein
LPRFLCAASHEDGGHGVKLVPRVGAFALGVQVPEALPWMEAYDDGSYTLWLRDTAVTSWATADYEKDRTEFEVYQSGPRSLWDEVETAYRWWEKQGRPGFERFGLTVDGDGERVWLDSPDNPVPVRRPDEGGQPLQPLVPVGACHQRAGPETRAPDRW